MSPQRGLTSIDGAIALIAILLIVEAWLAGHPEPILPGAIISGLIFAACAGLFLLIHRIDASQR